MKLSIITINYNNAEGLEKTIQSIANQIYQDFEYIVIDGGSTDGSTDIINKYEKNIDYWISEKDNGIYDAMNKGISKANGRYYMFLNSGDFLKDDDILQLCVKNITDHPETDIFYGDIICINNDAPPWIRTHPKKVDLAFFQKDNLNHQASLIRSELFNEYGSYPRDYKLASDHWLYINCIIDNKIFTYINSPLVFYDISGQSTVNREIYNAEMELIWQKFVPQYVTDLCNIVNDFRFTFTYKIVKAAVNINSKIQKVVKRGL